MGLFESECPDAAFEERVAHAIGFRNTTTLFLRGQMLDDLEAMLLERISLPNDQLKALAAKYPPPRAWYDEAHDASVAQE